MRRLMAGTRRAFLPCLFFSICLMYAAHAEPAGTKNIEAEASYLMEDDETPRFAEAMVLQLAKRSALQQAVAHVGNVTKAKHPRLTIEEIQAIAAAGLQVQILERTRTLVGETLRFRVKINAGLATAND